jgi:hypothetical protein
MCKKVWKVAGLSVKGKTEGGRWQGVVLKDRQKAEEPKLNVNLSTKIHKNKTSFWYSQEEKA